MILSRNMLKRHTKDSCKNKIWLYRCLAVGMARWSAVWRGKTLTLRFSRTLLFTTVLSHGDFSHWEIRVSFPWESHLRQSRATRPAVHAWCFCVFKIHRTRTWTTGSLTGAQMLMHAAAHGEQFAPKADSGKKNPLPHRGVEYASAACQSDAYQQSYIPAYTVNVMANFA